jgi:hypothetical protein
MVAGRRDGRGSHPRQSMDAKMILFCQKSPRPEPSRHCAANHLELRQRCSSNWLERSDLILICS